MRKPAHHALRCRCKTLPATLWVLALLDVIGELELSLTGAQHSSDVRMAQTALLPEFYTLLQRFEVVDIVSVRDLFELCKGLVEADAVRNHVCVCIGAYCPRAKVRVITVFTGLPSRIAAL